MLEEEREKGVKDICWEAVTGQNHENKLDWVTCEDTGLWWIRVSYKVNELMVLKNGVLEWVDWGW